jgi:hypothetical protein
MGALCYLAAWDARRAKLFDRCAPADGIVPVDQLVEQFMSVEPYSKAQRVFVIVDNGSAHRGKASIKRLQGRYRNRILVHTPVHASWLNQAEIYFSIVQRKVLTPSQSTKRRLRSDQPTRRLGGDGRGGRAGGSARGGLAAGTVGSPPWTEESIRSALSTLLRGRATWPTYDDFISGARAYATPWDEFTALNGGRPRWA